MLNITSRVGFAFRKMLDNSWTMVVSLWNSTATDGTGFWSRFGLVFGFTVLAAVNWPLDFKCSQITSSEMVGSFNLPM